MDLMYKYPTVTGLLALVGAYSVYKMYFAKEVSSVGALRLNGLHMNGVHMNGVHLNGVHKAGMHLNGTHYGALALNGLARK
jgi:hypothetical protein